MELLLRVAMLVPLLFGLCVHEWAHARAALALGDDTALRQGRLTLNPFAHLDPLGTLLPLLGLPFGWARPVPIDPGRFRAEVTLGRGLLLTSAAGPASNLLLAAASVLLLRLGSSLGVTRGALHLLADSARINLALCVFNLLPLPPLDGGRIVDGLVPFTARALWNRVSAAGPLLLGLLLVLPSLIGLRPFGWLEPLVQRLAGQ